jgi:hypothetical protein
LSRYDQPGFAGEFPGRGPLDAGSLSNTHGSDGAPAARPDGTSLGVQRIGWSFDSSQGQPGYTVPQGTDSTASAANPMLDKVSGQVTPVAAPPGHVVTPHHPNAGH